MGGIEHVEARFLQDLIAKQQMHEALMRYCRGADRCEPAAMLALFDDGATTHHGAFRGRVEDFVTDYEQRIKVTATSVMHALANVLIDIGPSVANSEASFVCYLGRSAEGGDLVDVMGGRYLDRWRRVGDRFKVIDRVVTHDWSTVIDQADHRFSRPVELFAAGGWYPHDPLYVTLSRQLT